VLLDFFETVAMTEFLLIDNGLDWQKQNVVGYFVGSLP
tara:strand:- start:46 stop:159 length:114 start_codon:yes stop_codon:yes gene_type:complete